MTAPPHRIERYAVLLRSGASLSFQRYGARDRAPFAKAPQSLGGLPCAAHDAGVMVPLGQDEGVWIACLPAADAVHTCLALAGEAGPSTQVSARAPAALVVLPGVRLAGDAFAPIRRTAPEHDWRIALSSRFARRAPAIETLALTLVSPEHFYAATGRAIAPADPRHAFGGWRLP